MCFRQFHGTIATTWEEGRTVTRCPQAGKRATAGGDYCRSRQKSGRSWPFVALFSGLLQQKIKQTKRNTMRGSSHYLPVLNLLFFCCRTTSDGGSRGSAEPKFDPHAREHTSNTLMLSANCSKSAGFSTGKKRNLVSLYCSSFQLGIRRNG